MDDPLKRDPRAMAALDRLLAEVAAERPEPSADFLARLTEQAEAAQPARPAPRRTAQWHDVLAGWREALGGWPALGGLAAAAIAGVWIGVAPPAPLEGYLTGSVTVELWPADLIGAGLADLEEG